MKILMTTLLVALLCFSASAGAAKPTNIAFASKQKTMFGGTYYVYKVGCSNGRRGVISGWNDKKKWCVGEAKKNCRATRLKAAALVCQ